MAAYDRAAGAYDLIMRASHAKDYRREADEVARLIRAAVPRARSVLDVACGNGHHLARLGRRFAAVEGIELSPAMIAEANRLHPDLAVHRGDMRTFRLTKRFDAVTCLFSSIGYMTSLTDLRRAISNMAAHLAPGGVLIVEGWFGPDDWERGRFGVEEASDDDMAVARAVLSTAEGRVSKMEMHYLIASADGIRHVSEVHRLGLFTPAQYERAMRAAHLEVHRQNGLTGRGVYIGVARPDSNEPAPRPSQPSPRR
jgi:SAM-dependent methyltransferase